jgi:hypothetical protein
MAAIQPVGWSEMFGGNPIALLDEAVNTLC